MGKNPRDSENLRRGIAALSETAYIVPPSDAFDLGEERKAPTEWRVLRAGENRSLKGTFLFDQAAADAVMADWRERGVDLTGDWNHAALIPGAEAPASIARWIPEIRNGELWATCVEWTDRARAQVEAREQRYFSPAFEFERETGRVFRILNLALTNIPALFSLDALSASALSATAADEEASMTPEEIQALQKRVTELEGKLAQQDGADLRQAIGLSATAGKAEAVAALSGLRSFRADVLAIAGEQSDVAALGALKALKTAAAEKTALAAEVAELKQGKLDEQFAGLMALSATEGYVFASPGKKDETIADAKVGGKVTEQSIAFLNALRKHGAKVSTSSVTAPAGGASAQITAEQHAVALSLGLTDEEYLASAARCASR